MAAIEAYVRPNKDFMYRLGYMFWVEKREGETEIVRVRVPSRLELESANAKTFSCSMRER